MLRFVHCVLWTFSHINSQVEADNIAVEKADAEAALAAAIPALEEAAAALNDLKKDDITEIRSFAKPHVLVQKVFCP
jgi:dynein heavy chain, axonemal